MEEKRFNFKLNIKSDVSISELCFLTYWSLMLFAKAVGWYDGQTAYKVILVISMVFWAIKMAMTKYSFAEYIIIFALLGLCGVITLTSGEKGLFICMMTMLGVKNLNIKRIMKVGIIVWGGTYLIKFIYNLINIDNVTSGIYNKIFLGYIRRLFMGYSHPNVFHVSFFMLTTLIVCYVAEKLSGGGLLLLFLGNIVVFFYSIGITGAATTGIYLILVFIFKNRKMNRIEKGIAFGVFPVILVLSLAFPLLLKGKAFEIVDKLFNNRMALANHFLTKNYFRLFGNNLAQITDSKITMDNSYVFSLIIYGGLMFLIICAGYLWMIWKQIREDRNIELITTLSLLIGGLAEPYLFNTSFKNISILFLGYYIFEGLGKIGKKEIGVFSRFDRKIEIKNIELNLFDFSCVSKKSVIVISTVLTLIFGILYWLINPPRITEGYGYVLYFDMVRNILTFYYIAILFTIIVLGIRVGRFNLNRDEK